MRDSNKEKDAANKTADEIMNKVEELRNEEK